MSNKVNQDESQAAPEIIVDDDWKEQVRKEKERLARQEKSAHPPQSPHLPEPSLGFLITMLSTQALSALGMIPDPDSKQRVVDLAMAKHFIDLLGILQEKTQGNLSEDESQLLEETLHQLRLLFVATEESAATSKKERHPSIELP